MIGSLEQYQAGEAKLKELLASFAGSGDLADADEKGISKDDGNWQNVSQRIAEIKKELDAYRDAHPQEFQTNG